MKAILFCNLPYAFSILKPIADVLKAKNITFIWYVPNNIKALFPFSEQRITSSIKEIYQSNNDMIFVPGNQVPWFLSGVKVQVFHGLAGEKKGHFRIRDYFDLYLTQGPYFTERFDKLKARHQNFEVAETGWPKLDELYRRDASIDKKREQLLHDTGATKIILYAPTFSPSLTSATDLHAPLLHLSEQTNYIVIVKFHDKHNEHDRAIYQQSTHDSFILSSDDSINGLLKLADLMISDTSSAVYEFLLLDKPVITLKSQSDHVNWLDIKNSDELVTETNRLFSGGDAYQTARQEVIDLYHPYSDGRSAERMVETTIRHIHEHGIPKRRKVSFARKFKIMKKYGFPPWLKS